MTTLDEPTAAKPLTVVEEEPVAIAAAVRAVLVVLAAFGVGIRADEIELVAGAVVPLYLAVETVAAVLTRRRVKPVAKIEAEAS